MEADSRKLMLMAPPVMEKKQWLQKAFEYLDSNLRENRHPWCCYPEVCTEIIKHLYSFYARQGKDTIEVVDEMMQRECKNCAQCIESYYHAKGLMDSDVNGVCSFLDAQRLSKESALATDEQTNLWLFEVLRYFGPLLDSDVSRVCVELITQQSRRDLCNNGVFIGVYHLLGHHEEHVRQLMWQYHVRNVTSAEDYARIHPLMAYWEHQLRGGTPEQWMKFPYPRHMYQMQTWALWKGLVSILSKIKEGALTEIAKKNAGLVSFVLDKCGEASEHQESALHCAKILLEGLGDHTWSLQMDQHLLNQKHSPPHLFKTLESLVVSASSPAILKHSFAAMAQLVASCERRSEWDVLYERTLHILLRQVQEDKRFVGDATIRGAALKDGLKLACFALSSENDHTKGGHHMSEAINKLFINNAHIAGSLTERMGLPLAAELASSMIMVDASVLGDLLGGRVGKAGKCIPEKLLTCALRFKSTWKCIPSAWMSTAQFCDGRSKISGSRVSMGILVAGAVLSHAMRNGEGATHSTTSMINLHPCRQISSAAQPDERQYGLCVQISGNQQELAQKLHKIVENHLKILLQKKEDLFIGVDISHGWRALVLLCGGLNPVLQSCALDLVKTHLSKESILQEIPVLEGILEGCQENWEISLMHLEQRHSLDLLSCLTPTMTVLRTVLYYTTGRPGDGLLMFVNKITGAGSKVFSSLSGLPSRPMSRELQENFISILQMLWTIEATEHSITAETLPVFTKILEKLLSLGPFLVDSVLLSWSQAVKTFVRDIPRSRKLPASTSCLLKDILQTSTTSPLRKLTLGQTVAMMSDMFERALEVPCLAGKADNSPFHQLGLKKPRHPQGAFLKPLTTGPTDFPAQECPPKSHAPAAIRVQWGQKTITNARDALLDSKKTVSTLGKKRKFTGGTAAGKKSLADVLNHENRQIKSNSQYPTGRIEDAAWNSERNAQGHTVVRSVNDGKLFDDDDDDDLSIAPVTASTCGTPLPTKTKVIDLGLVPMPLGKKRVGGSNAPRKAFSIDTIHQQILEWDVADLKSSRLIAKPLETGPKIPEKFSAISQYNTWFHGLLLEELRAVVFGKWEEWLDHQRGMTPMIVKHVQRCSNLHNITLLYEPDDDMRFHSDDLLLLSGNPVESKDHLPLQRCLAIVRGVSTIYESDGRKSLEVRVCFGTRGGHVHQPDPGNFVVNGWKCHAVIITSILTQQREFQALCSMPLLPQPVVNQILNPLPPVQATLSVKKIGLSSEHERHLLQKYNSAQQEAVASATIRRGIFTLVQGPPGTGKTSAIVGIVSALLSKLAQSKKETKSDNTRSGTEFDFPWNKRRKKSPRLPNETKACESGRILICAQSNSAIDEIVARISLGEVFTEGSTSNRIPSMVRMGRLDVTHTTVQAYNIDSVCRKELERDADAAKASKANEDSQKYLNQMRSELSQAQEELGKLKNEDDFGHNKEHALKDRIRFLSGAIGRTKSDLRSGIEAMDQARRSSRFAVLRKAKLVFSTLSSAAGELTSLCSFGTKEQQIAFDALIVDEAAQAIEPALLVPFRLLRPTACVIMVGDPQQLPPTIMSSVARESGLGQSMFERFEKAGYPVTMLLEQYRMHPKISRFPSMHFYQSRLVDGAGITEESRRAPFHDLQHFGPFVFFDCAQGRENRSQRFNGSLENLMEVELVTNLFAAAKVRHQEHIKNVALITPYKAQVARLRRSIEAHPELSRIRGPGGTLDEMNVEVATVDSFQGREADVVIISLVRAQAGAKYGTIGFLEDERRMNVALTRPRRSLWVVGHAETLNQCRAWRAFISHAESVGCRLIARPPFNRLVNDLGSHSVFDSLKPAKTKENNHVQQEQHPAAQHENSVVKGIWEVPPVYSTFKAPNRNIPKIIQGPQSEFINGGAVENDFANDEKGKTQATPSRAVPERMHVSSAHSPSMKLWKKKMGIAEDPENLSVPNPSKISPRTVRRSEASQSLTIQPEGTTQLQHEMPSKQTGSFDINSVLGDVIRSNSRSKAFISNRAKDFTN